MITPYSKPTYFSKKKYGDDIEGYFKVKQKRDIGAISFMDLEMDRILLPCILVKKSSKNNFEKGNWVFIRGTVGKNNKKKKIVIINQIIFIEKGYPLYDSSYYKLADLAQIRRNSIYRLSEMKEIVYKRSQLYFKLRNFLKRKNFIEVNSRILTSQYGGATSDGFTTFSNQTKSNLYLSPCPELDLKRYLSAGYSKIFSLHRCFRNESFDKTHHPEFQMIEIYEVGSSCDKMKELFFEFISKEYPLMEQKSNKIKSFFNFKNFKMEDYEREIELNSGWLVSRGVPHEESPLCKEGINGISEQIEIYYNNLELVNIYSEETNCEKLSCSFQKTSGRDHGKFKFLDDFKYEIPTTGGMGIGIDRLLMILEEKKSIEQVLPFIQV